MRFKPGSATVLLYSAFAMFGAVVACQDRLFEGVLILVLSLPMVALLLGDRLTTSVDVSDQGVAWRVGGTQGSLSWDRIAGCYVERCQDGPPDLYLVEAGTLGLHRLPVFRVALMKAVARRRGRFARQLARLGAAR